MIERIEVEDILRARRRNASNSEIMKELDNQLVFMRDHIEKCDAYIGSIEYLVGMYYGVLQERNNWTQEQREQINNAYNKNRQMFNEYVKKCNCYKRKS